MCWVAPCGGEGVYAPLRLGGVGVDRDATGTAAAYCRTYSGRPEIVTITSTDDGTKTVVFDCNP